MLRNNIEFGQHYLDQAYIIDQLLLAITELKTGREKADHEIAALAWTLLKKQVQIEEANGVIQSLQRENDANQSQFQRIEGELGNVIQLVHLIQANASLREILRSQNIRP